MMLEVTVAGDNGVANATDAAAVRTEEAILDDLRALAERERMEVDQLEALLTGRREHLNQLDRAISALSGEAPPKKSPRLKATAKNRDSNDWHISEQRIADVWELVRHRTEPFTATGVADENDGLSPESARRALMILREQEYVRVVGRGRGGGTLLLPMPDADEREYPDGA